MLNLSHNAYVRNMLYSKIALHFASVALL